ncbi:gem-associated protein 5-like isoform X3 [Sinocyclocheilus anshuiensis]|uniref:Gem-associated protein 5-like n=1 Tax=Sinocyclocheilus anshuiensis TaxID=1608454 RepID=A0A671S1G7_9TELE|nr:PREDICTED: gem-associated protein 5-like isoform X3 [Sinocyclocheilus anshuiensis]
MHQRHLPASPNWYCSRCSDINGRGVLGFGAKNTIYLLNVTASSPAVTGELTGHTERVSGFAFCPHDGQERICASTSDDKTVKIWDAGQKILLKEHNVHQSTISAVHWSPVQKLLLVTGDEKGIVVCYWFSSNDTQSFFPEPRTIFCLSCSPHEENYIAVGYKDGMIVVIDISKKGEVIHRLRGHDDEIHALAWCPQPREEPLYGRSEDKTDGSNGVTETAEMGCYLASGSRDQTVRIWSTARGKGVMTLKLPFLKRRGAGVDPVVKERLWLTVHWPKGQPSQIVSSCFGGEIIMWDLMKSGKQKWSLLGSSSDGQNHSRIVFNMSSFRSGDRELLLSTSMDREIKCWDLASLECCWTLPTLGGFVYCLSFSPVGTGCLALGIGDSMIRVWNTLSIQNQYDIKTFWQGIKSKVTALAWHPLKEGTLAFGTDDGKVGINEVYSNKPPQISSTYHHRTVYSLSWGPPVPPMSFGGSGDKPSYSLYSCAGEGVIFQHDPWKLSGEASNIDKLIRDTNNIKHKIPPHTDLSWKPDGSVLAIGNEDGSIAVLKAPMLKLLCTVQQHHKIINSLRWHHEHSSQNELQYMLASGSSNAIVYVHDLKSAIETPSEIPVLMTESFRTLSGHTNKITSLAWSPHHDGRLVTVCYDGTAQVWDVLKEEPVCNYRGHSGRLLCVQWSTVHPDLVWTGGDDFTLHEWAVSKQEHVTPPKSKKRVEMEKKRGPQKKSKKKKAAPEKGGMKAEERELPLGEEIKGAAGSGAEEGQLENDKEEEERENTDGPSVTGWSREISVDTRGTERVQNGERFSHAIKREVKDEKKREKSDMSLKKRKPRSILPLSTSMDHRPKEELQQDCLTLAAVRYSHGQSGTCVPGSGDHIQLGLFTDRDALYRMFQEEEESHVEAGHYDSMVYLRLWKGDPIGAINLAAEKGELTDHLLSLAPVAGYQVWARTVEAYVKQLCHHEQFLKAASHLVSIHKLYEAINLLKSHQLYREAIALARARLQPEDPVLKNLYMSWAAVLEKDGHYATAAKCYLAADSNFDAAKVIAKKGDVISLRTAANLAQISGESELAHSLSLRCAKDLMLFQDWTPAQEVLRTQGSLLGHRLVFSVNEILTQRLADTDVVTWSVASSHTWSKSCEENFLSMVHRVWQSEFGVAATDLVQVKMLHQQLRTVENPPATTSVPLKQLLFHMSLDVTLCALSQLLCDWPSVLEELLQALTRGYEAGHFTLMAEMCQLLVTQGLESVTFYKQKLDSTDERSLVISQSVEALVCYQLMYKKWWNYSAETSALTNNTISNGHRLTEKNHSEVEANCNGEAQSDVIFSEGFWKVLLSEPHANLQATQRAIAEIQRRVTSLIQQHNPCKDSHASPQALSTSQSETSEDQGGSLSGKSSESLSTLTARVAEHHKALAAIPELVKKYPFPDVMECCIVLLHMEKHFTPFPPHIHSKATTLLCKYGTTELLCKAWKRLTQ